MKDDDDSIKLSPFCCLSFCHSLSFYGCDRMLRVLLRKLLRVVVVSEGGLEIVLC